MDELDEEGLDLVDLFCGAGGFSEGFRQTGLFNIKYGLDNWQPAMKTFQKNLSPEKVPNGSTDIREIEISDIPDDPDVIIGGPPCTYFSMSNKAGNGDKEEGMVLVRKFLEIIKKKDPDFWIMENIPRLKPSLEEEIENDELKEIGLEIPERNVYVASEFGVPQKRRRLFSGDYPDIGDEKFGFKEETESRSMRGVIEKLPHPLEIEDEKEHQDPLYEQISRKAPNLTDQYYNTFLTKHEWIDSRKNKEEHRFYGKMKFPDLTINHTDGNTRPSRTVTAFVVKSGRETIAIKDRRSCFRLDLKDHVGYLRDIDFEERKTITESLSRAFDNKGYEVSTDSIVSKVEKVRNPREWKEWWKDDNDKDKPFEEKRDRWWLNDGEMTYLLEADEDEGVLRVYLRRHRSAAYRIPTVREIASIQSFPITFQFHADSFSKKHRLVGNAVPPLLARKFARAILIEKGMGDPFDGDDTTLKYDFKDSENERAFEPESDSPHKGDRYYRYNRRFVDFIGLDSNSSRKGCRVDIDNQKREKPLHPIYREEEIEHIMGWRCRLFTGYAETVDDMVVRPHHIISLIETQDQRFISKAKEMSRELVEVGKKQIPDASTYQAFFTARKKDLFHSPYWLTNILDKLIKRYFDDEDYRDDIIKDIGEELDLREEIDVRVGIAAKMLAGVLACEMMNSGTYWMIENLEEVYSEDDWPRMERPDEGLKKSGCEEIMKRIEDI